MSKICIRYIYPSSWKVALLLFIFWKMDDKVSVTSGLHFTNLTLFFIVNDCVVLQGSKSKNVCSTFCRYCPGGPDSDFEYSTQSYTGYEVRFFLSINQAFFNEIFLLQIAWHIYLSHILQLFSFSPHQWEQYEHDIILIYKQDIELIRWILSYSGSLTAV